MPSIFSSMKVGFENNLFLAYYNKERDEELINLCHDLCFYGRVFLCGNGNLLTKYDKNEVKALLVKNWFNPLELIKAKKPYSIYGYHAKFKAYLSYCRVMKSNCPGKDFWTFFLSPENGNILNL